MTKYEALKLALEALGEIEWSNNSQWQSDRAKVAITAIKEALAQPEPWEKFCDSNCVWTDHHPDCKLAQRKPLTDEEAQQTFAKHNCTISTHLAGILARAIEAKLKEKNT